MRSLLSVLCLFQRKLACGAQHVFWSSIYGGVLGDEGRFDAFETVMEILRAKVIQQGYQQSLPK